MLLQPAFILHYRPYRETSALLEAFTEQGRLSLVARGALRRRALLQPFQPLFLSWRGKAELKNLITAEPRGTPFYLRGRCLLSGFYLNELLMHLCPKEDPCPQLFQIYEYTLSALHTGALKEKTLRLFEKKLLEELGYGMSLQCDIEGETLEASADYEFVFEQGFKKTTGQTGAYAFKGTSLLSLAAEELENEEALRDAKCLMRALIGHLLGHKELHSRKLF